MYLLRTSALLVVSFTANVSLIKQLMHSLASRLLQAPHRLFLWFSALYDKNAEASICYERAVKWSIKVSGPASLGPKC